MEMLLATKAEAYWCLLKRNNTVAPFTNMVYI